MNEKTTARLERLKHYPTRYELVMAHPDGRKMLIAYCIGRSRRNVVDAIQDRGPEIVASSGLPADARFRFTGKNCNGPIADLGGWVVSFTGRTQREAIRSESTLRYVGE